MALLSFDNPAYDGGVLGDHCACLCGHFPHIPAPDWAAGCWEVWVWVPGLWKDSEATCLMCTSFPQGLGLQLCTKQLQDLAFISLLPLGVIKHQRSEDTCLGG